MLCKIRIILGIEAVTLILRPAVGIFQMYLFKSPFHRKSLSIPATGGPLHTVAWKQCWVVLKHGILYLYKTSFDIAAQHAYSVRNFSVAPVEEKRKQLVWVHSFIDDF